MIHNNNNNAAEVKDNVISINNGDWEFNVSDAVCKAIIKLCEKGIGENVEWTITETKDLITGNKFYVIYNSCHGATKSVANNLVKNIAGIKTINVAGKSGSYKAWGFTKKADAEKAVATLPPRVEC